MNNEIWKDIPEYEGMYQVSNLGRIKSLNYMGQKGNESILLQRINEDGYCDVRLSKNDHRKRKLVHRLVLKSFVGFSDLTVNHINEIRSDNRLENLEYMTTRENVTYSQGTKVKVEYNNGNIEYFNSAVLCAEKMNCSQQAILYIIKYMCDGRIVMKNNDVKKIEKVVV